MEALKEVARLITRQASCLGVGASRNAIDYNTIGIIGLCYSGCGIEVLWAGWMVIRPIRSFGTTVTGEPTMFWDIHEIGVRQ